MDNHIINKQCGVCHNEFQFSKHKYNGKYIRSYDLWVCTNCWESNWDGWSPCREPKILEHLKEKNLSIPNRNSKGLLPRGLN